MKLSLAAAVVGGVLMTGAATSFAAPGVPGAGSVGAGSLAEPAATFVCRRDMSGWHYMRGSRRVTCRPARPRGTFWLWRCEGPRCGWWHRNERRWND